MAPQRRSRDRDHASYGTYADRSRIHWLAQVQAYRAQELRRARRAHLRGLSWRVALESRYKIELDVRFATSKDNLKDAVHDLIRNAPLKDGNVIRITAAILTTEKEHKMTDAPEFLLFVTREVLTDKSEVFNVIFGEHKFAATGRDEAHELAEKIADAINEGTCNTADVIDET